MKERINDIINGIEHLIWRSIRNPQKIPGTLRKFVGNIPAMWHQLLIWLQDKLGAFAEAVLVFVVGFAITIILIITGVGEPHEWAATIASFTAASIIIFFTGRTYRHHAIMIEVTLSYLIHGGRSFLDNLLGKLIAGTWRREEIKPGDALFNVLTEIARGDDWELKRRVAEALPALGTVDAKRAVSIVSILRDDWDPQHWGSDLRRRAVEALIIRPATGAVPLIHRVKENSVSLLLQLREKDEVYTAIAVIEALSYWESIRPKKAAQLMLLLSEFAESIYTPDENQALEELKSLMQLTKTESIVKVLKKIEEMRKSPNHLVRIAAARNILHLSQTYPERTLDFMLEFLDPSQQGNVRRPVARERSLDFAISMLASLTYKSKAEDILCRLVSDHDEIIRVTTFDKAEKLKEKHPDVLLTMCNKIVDNKEKETSASLLERAERISQELRASPHPT